jgi:Iron-containing redox enzyme
MALGLSDIADPLSDDDLHLALYCCYELHYRSFDGVDPAWEWEPSLLSFRAGLERAFEARLCDLVEHPGRASAADMDLQLRALIDSDDAPPLSRYLETQASLGEALEFLVHRSAYHLKEADPHTFALPRLGGKPKAAMVEIQADEYGGGDERWMHATLFADALAGVGLDPSYGAYLDVIPGTTLATVNLMSLFGLHRRWRGAIVGHLAIFEMTSTGPNRRYGNAFRRLGFGPEMTRFFDEHVEADAVHENVAANDLAGSLALESPEMAADVLFGAKAILAVDHGFIGHLTSSWERGESSLLQPLAAPAPA